MVATRNAQGSSLRQLYDSRADIDRQRIAAIQDADDVIERARAAGKFPIRAERDEESAGWAQRYMEATKTANSLRQEIAQIDQALAAENDHNALLADKNPISLDDRKAAAGVRIGDPTFGFKSVSDWALSVYRANGGRGPIDRRLFGAAPSDYSQLTGDDSGAGYMAPPAFEQIVRDLVDSEEMDVDIMSLVNPTPSSVNQTQLLIDETTVWSGNGIYANWRSEGVQMNPTKLITKARSLVLWEAYVFVLMTSELLADVAGLQSRLTDESAEAFRWIASEAIMNGDGVGKPLGFFSADAPYISIAEETSQAAGTIVAANVTKMYARLLDYRGAFWLAHRSTFPQLMTMSLANINTGVVSLYTPPSGGIYPNGGMLMGLPVYLTEHCQEVGTKGDLVLVSPNGYAARKRTADPEFASSIHLYFDYNIQAFRYTFRFGGMPLLSAPVAPAHGSDNLAHFVALNTRS